MIIEPKIRGFICTTAHPQGCEKNVQEQIAYIQKQTNSSQPYKNVLIIGGSTGYGLASRITAAYLGDANTLNVSFEKPYRVNKPASAGWYNTYAFEKIINQAKPTTIHQSILGDAFSNEIKEQTANFIQEKMGKIDLLIYSLAAPQRKDPNSDNTYKSVIKPIGASLTSKSIDLQSGNIAETTIPPASAEEIANTIKVMGGEDWKLWIDYLKERDLLENNFLTIAFSYIGPRITQAIYRSGTIGQAKVDLEKSCDGINETLKTLNGKALISVNKALVTQAAAAIPILPLYLAILYKVMKEKNLHEGCIEQIGRLFNEKLKNHQIQNNTIFLDDYEMQKDVQEEVLDIWNQVNNENLNTITDFAGYKKDFARLFGFEVSEINYNEDVAIDLMINAFP